MKLKKSFQLAWNILIHSKLRSWLTIIGIIIGIAAVVSILSISTGAQDQLEDQLGSLGADILTITPGFSKAMGGMGFSGGGGPPGMFEDSSDEDSENLTSRDITVVKSIDNVDVVMGTVSSSGDLTYLSKTASVSVTGVDEKVWSEITTDELSSGRFLTNGDTYSIVIGENLATQTFEDIPLNSKVTIEGKTFKVVGILESGNGVYMSIETARDVFDDIGEKEFDSISVKIEDVELSDETVENIETKLMQSRGILNEDEKDFSVSNPSTMQETMQETMSTMSIFLGAIAAISLIVGGIGIANTMFTSVLEKTREIGIMKAIGTKNKDILLIFLINSGLIGLVGGLGGIILGTIGAGLIGSMTSSTGGITSMFSNTAVTPGLLIFALFFSMAIGMIAGVIPAYRASKLKPVDALRYE
ncbi:ABC transporter permease [Candidatus Pacearchaeota archaeon]|jgi:putative ABC transport system permease protein|nr:ABC transporter permease [Candidatus Pacearchaeota archaeon]